MPRPLSPHLQIYRWEMTMVASILHRITGIFLWAMAVVILLLTADNIWWQVLPFDLVNLWPILLSLDRIMGYFLLSITALIIFSLLFHGLNGIRHLVWDMGFGFDMGMARFSAWLVLLTSLVATGFFIWQIISLQ